MHNENGSPSERLLQAIWQHQRLKRGELKTADGKTVRVFHPGFASLEGGPDFRAAVLQTGDDAPRSGDVEIDLRSNNWRAHGHYKNKNFQNVILHVVWNEAKSASNENLPAILSLEKFLDASLAELSLSLQNESLRSLPENLRGKCARRYVSWAKRNLLNFCDKLRSSVLKIKPHNFAPAQKARLGANALGKSVSRAWL